MSNFGLSCDVCNRENVGITWVNRMKFCAKCYQETFGNNTGKFPDLLNSERYELKISNLEHKLNEKEQRIAELEEQLKDYIKPKFKVGQDIFYYHIARNKIYSGVVEDIKWFAKIKGIYYRITQLQRDYFWIREDELFSTKEEAQAKLKELGEKK